jgi:dTDP-4-amino-4,6-dideoxygalactose transaminase
MRMSALTAAILRPQLRDLPRRAKRWNAIHDRIAAGLTKSQHVHVPDRGGDQIYSATSIQFSVLGLQPDEMRLFLERAHGRGLPIKWFGADHQTGFTSAPRHWRYAGDQGPLAATNAVLAQLCDIRTPITLSDDECDLIAMIVRETIQSVLRVPVENGNSGHRPMSENASKGRNL